MGSVCALYFELFIFLIAFFCCLSNVLFDLVLYQIGSPYSMCDCPSDRYMFNVVVPFQFIVHMKT